MSRLTSVAARGIRVFRTVGSAMIGVRSGKRHEEDSAALSPLTVVVVVVIFMAFFVGGLVTLATFIAGG